MSSGVVVNGRFLLVPRTGLQRVAHDLLSAAQGLGLETHVVAPGRPAYDEGAVDVEQVGVDRVVPAAPGRAGALAWEQVELPLAAGRRRLLSLANLAPIVAARSTVMVHDIAPIVGPQWFTGSGRLHGRIALAAARRAERVLTVSSVVRDELASRGVPAERVAVVRPAVDASWRPAAQAAVAALRDKHDLTRPYLLFVGWADPRKDLATALAASERLQASVPHDLVLVGRALPSFAAVDVGAAPGRRMLGFVSDDDLRALVTGAAGLLYPTRYEGFGLPPLEAWACGTPALVADLPVLRESGQGRATYVPVGDVTAWAEAMRAVLAGEIGVPELPEWTWTDAARQLIAALPLA
ncbi:MAG: glycosyltransferase family 4 protein [Frankiales bacterium]|nr:glycosyltransferase family 4 protein [Frankiales bacterium]